MRIQHNMSALNVHRELTSNQGLAQKSTEKLSSGYRINRAADDAAGLSISEKMRSQVRGLNRASDNAQDGISMIQAAEGALTESHSILQRMRELAVQGANGVPAFEDREAMLAELEQLGEELERIASTTNFNGKYLLTGVYGGQDSEVVVRDENKPLTLPEESAAINLQVGANTNVGDVISVKIRGVSRSDLLGEIFGNPQENFLNDVGRGNEGGIREDGATGNAAGLSETYPDANTTIDETNWQTLINVLDGNVNATGEALTDVGEYTGLARVSNLRSELGAVQNRLEHTVLNVDTVAENLQSAESRIRDVDMAKEMMNYTKQNILKQAGTAMLAQANQDPQLVLQLLR